MAVQNSRRNRKINIITYGEKNVSKNFKFRELKGGFTSYTNNELKSFRFNLRTLQYVQLVRSYFLLPIRINCSWRTSAQNKSVGGIANSAHLYENKYGGAIDFSTSVNANKWKWLFAYFLRRMKEVVGIKYMYIEIGRDGFVHIDDRDIGLGVQQANGSLKNGYTLAQVKDLAKQAGGKASADTIDLINKISKKKFRAMLNEVRKENANYYKEYKKGVKWLK